MKRFIWMWVLLSSLGALAGCNTIKGVGQDVKAGGAAIEKAAEKSGAEK